MKLMVCGSRDYKNFELMLEKIRFLAPSLIIHGGAKGADQIAEMVAKVLGIPTKIYKPDWEKNGKAAGVIRNTEMLEKEQPDFLLAFYWQKKTPGTYDTVSKARKMKIRYEEVIGGIETIW